MRNGAQCVLRNNVPLTSASVLVCHACLILGDNIQLSPNVQIYDHDHDYRAEGGLAAMKYKTAPVEIGNNVWIGANCVILRGTKIGDNCVVAAGSVIKGEFPANTLIYQKRYTEVKTREVGV